MARDTLPEIAHKRALARSGVRERERVQEATTVISVANPVISLEIAPTPKPRDTLEDVEETALSAVSSDISPETAQAPKWEETKRDAAVNALVIVSSAVNSVTLPEIAELKSVDREEREQGEY